MSAGDRTTNHDCGGEAAAYVLGALTEEEVEKFREHLGTCAVCRDEVAALEGVVDVLPMAAPQYEAPRGLRRKVMQSIRSEQEAAIARRRRPRSFSGWVRLPMPALAAALAVVIVTAGVLGAELGSTGSQGTRVITAATSVGSAEVKLSGGHGELVVRNLSPPPAGYIYEVWLKRAGEPPSPTSTLFSVTSSGAGTVGLPGTLHGVQQVLVTPEPDGGSQVPTHAPVIAARLT